MKARNPTLHAVLMAVLLLALAAPAALAQAAVEMEISPEETRFGRATDVTGTVTDAGAPVAGRPVRLEGRRHPFNNSFRLLDTATTNPDGSYAFGHKLDRNWQLRVTAGDAAAEPARAYVFPAFTLRFEALSPTEIRLVQRYRVPYGVKLTRPTQFYVGPPGARRGPRRAKAEVERTSHRRYRSTAVISIPATWEGRFQYASCFRYSPGSGMGNPRTGCPKTFDF